MSEIFCVRPAGDDEPLIPHVQLGGQRIVLTAERGAPGPVGPAGGSALTRTAATTLSGHRMVYAVDSASVATASAGDLAHFSQALGLTLGAATAGSDINIQRSGQVAYEGWSFTPGPVLLGLDGALVQTLAPGSLYSLIIGFAVDATTLYLDIGSPIILEA